MKKFFIVLLFPMLLASCGGSSSSVPSDFKQTYHVEDSKKGQKISTQEAGEIAQEISAKMDEKSDIYLADSNKFIEDSQQFSYSFKNVIDDSLYLNSYVNYSATEEFFSQTVELLNDEGYRSTSTNYEYAIDDTMIEAVVYENGSGFYWTYAKEGYKYNGIFDFLSKMILECGNQMKNLLQQVDSYKSFSEVKGSGITLEFRSSGPGCLYFRLSYPTMGITIEALFEEYWLTYEYMYTDMTKLLKNLPKEYQIELEYERMVTELHIDFQHATINRPDLTNLTKYN